MQRIKSLSSEFNCLGSFVSSAAISNMPSSFIAVTVSPCCVVVCEISSMIVSSDVSGLARQLIEINEKSLCSMAFHLLVAGGK